MCFLRPLLTWQQCIQNIPKNLREADCKKKFLRGCFSNLKYMLENFRVFVFTSYLNLWKEVKKSELNLNIEFGRFESFMHNFYQQDYWITSSILRSERGDRNHHITPTYSIRVGKIYIKRWDKTYPASFFILSRLSYK